MTCRGGELQHTDSGKNGASKALVNNTHTQMTEAGRHINRFDEGRVR